MRATPIQAGLGFLSLLVVACAESPESFGGDWAGYVGGSPSWAFLQQDDGGSVAGNVTYPSGALVGSVRGNRLTFTLTTGDIYCTGVFRGSATIRQLPDRKRMSFEASGADSCIGATTYSGQLDLLLCMQPTAMCGPDWTGADPRCVDVSSDFYNCGGCGRVCDGSQACFAGQCFPLACTGPVPLEDPTSVPAGQDRLTMVLADVDGDGVLDAVTSGRTGVGVLRGDGAGSFLPPIVTSLDGAVASAAGDLDGDGRLDLVVYATWVNQVTWTWESALHVLLGRGDGTFLASVVLPLGQDSLDPVLYRPVALADLDGDGALDIASRVGPGSLLHVRLGEGTGGFGPPLEVPLSGQPTGIVAADLDADGDVDLAVVASSPTWARTLDVLHGNGDGTFTVVPGIDALGGAGDLTVADVDGDGAQDVVVARNWAYESASVLYGNGDGTLAPAVSVAGPGGEGVAVGDLDGDGREDIVGGSSELALLLGLGDRAFQDAHPYPIAGGGNVVTLATADLDGDGRIDIAASIFSWSGTSSPVMVFRACAPPP